MKNLKKVTAIIMGASLIISSAAIVIAENNKSIKAETSVSVEDNTTSKAIIKSIEKDEDGTRVLISTLDEDSMEIMLNVFEDTNVDLDSLKEGDTVSATYSKAMTRSIPPQSSAIEIKKETEDLNDNIQKAETLVNLNATIEEISDEDGYESILVKDNENSQISLNIDEATIIMDIQGIPLNLNELKAGDKINIVSSPAMTYSIPPQTYAYAVILNNEQVAVPQYIEAGKVTTENDTTVIESKDGNYIITVTEDTEITPFKTRNIVKVQDIVEGTPLFVWYDTVAESLPAQATATKVMVLQKEEIEEVE